MAHAVSSTGKHRCQHAEQRDAEHLKALHQDIVRLHGVCVCAKLHIKAFGKHAGRLFQRHVRRAGRRLNGVLHRALRQPGQHGQQLRQLACFQRCSAVLPLCRGAIFRHQALHHLHTGVAGARKGGVGRCGIGVLFQDIIAGLQVRVCLCIGGRVLHAGILLHGGGRVLF